MRDPHVEKLYYQIGSGEGISYKDPEAIAFSNQLGTFDLRDGNLSISPTEHFAAEDNARLAVEPFLRTWEIAVDLNSNVGMIRFTFERAELIDRNPAPPGASQVIEANVAEMIMLSASVSLHLTCSKNPQPPTAFRTTPEVEIGYRRWIGHRAGREPLQSMVFVVLTLLQSTAGSRKQAAQIFEIDPAVLSTIGKLSSTKGDANTARKIRAGVVLQELSGSERQWLEQAVRRLIYRLGERASGVPLTRIRMSDLPSYKGSNVPSREVNYQKLKIQLCVQS